MRTKFFLLLILVLTVVSCNRKSLNEAGNAVVTTENGATWCIMPDATITNPEIISILNDSVIPYLKRNFYSPIDNFISIWIDDYDYEDIGENKRWLFINCCTKEHFMAYSEEFYKNAVRAYIYIDDYLIELSYLMGKGIDPFFETGTEFLAFKDTGYGEYEDESTDDSVVFWYYIIDNGKMFLGDTNDMYMTRKSKESYSPRDTICIRPVNKNKEIIFDPDHMI